MSARILVVDDILPNVKLLEAKLAGEYYDVLTATNGADALKKVATESPDLVLLDVMMPKLNGYEVAQRIRTQLASTWVPIIFLSAASEEEN